MSIYLIAPFAAAIPAFIVWMIAKKKTEGMEEKIRGIDKATLVMAVPAVVWVLAMLLIIFGGG